MWFKSTRLHILLSILFLVIGTTARAQNLEGAALVRALERGGYVVVMRHASSPSEPPAKDSADVENTRDERQLDEKGRTTATAMGKALHELKIPLGEVLSSPTYRPLETVRYAQLGAARTYSELGDNGKSMQGRTEAQRIRFSTRSRSSPQERTHSSSPTTPISRWRSRCLEASSPTVRRSYLDRTAKEAQSSWLASRSKNGLLCGRENSVADQALSDSLANTARTRSRISSRISLTFVQRGRRRTITQKSRQLLRSHPNRDSDRAGRIFSLQ
jgi:hypothetical protein